VPGRKLAGVSKVRGNPRLERIPTSVREVAHDSRHGALQTNRVGLTLGGVVVGERFLSTLRATHSTPHAVPCGRTQQKSRQLLT